MPAADWNVSAALSLVTEAIHQGARTRSFWLHEETAKTIRARLSKDFEAQKSRGVKWKDWESKILYISKKVGKRAVEMTMDAIHRGEAKLYELPRLDEAATCRALKEISLLYCQPDVIAGGFCKNFSCDSSTPGGEKELLRLAKILRSSEQDEDQ